MQLFEINQIYDELCKKLYNFNKHRIIIKRETAEYHLKKYIEQTYDSQQREIIEKTVLKEVITVVLPNLID